MYAYVKELVITLGLAVIIFIVLRTFVARAQRFLISPCSPHSMKASA